MRKDQAKIYSEDLIQEIQSANRYANTNVETPNGMNREEGDKKKDKINSQNS